MKIKIFMSLLIILIILPYELKAQYNDPGSISFIFQFLLVIFGFVVFYFQSIRLYLTKIIKKILKKDESK
jgi:hypothetical protein